MPDAPSVEERALASAGRSGSAIYRMVARAFAERGVEDRRVIDVGCGHGAAWAHLKGRFSEYVGVDVTRYGDFPEDGTFVQCNLDSGSVPLEDATGDLVMAVETIEHLENPRAFMRELVRLAKPGGWVVVTTPNQLSLLSLLTLMTKGQFSHFQDGSYPAHITALLEVDLVRIATECGLSNIGTDYSREGRIVFTGRHYPRAVSRLFPRACSDNLLVVGQKQSRLTPQPSRFV